MKIPCVATLLLTSVFFGNDTPVSSPPLLSAIMENVKSCSLHDINISDKAPINSLIDALENDGFIAEEGDDDLRKKFVPVQGYFEQTLASQLATGEIKTLVGIIHTPAPATPLCTKHNANVQNVLDPSSRDDQEKLWTVRARTQIVRDYLDNGGRLYVIYPKTGENLREPEQLAVYQEELDRFPNLLDTKLSCSEMDCNMIGATYLFEDAENHQYAFCIKARQAIDNQPNAEWVLWFGAINNECIKSRVDTVLKYIEDNGGPNLRHELHL